MDERLRQMWISKVQHLKNQALTYLDSEISKVPSDNVSELNAINEVKKLVADCDCSFSGLYSPQELVSGFPTILLPAPDFVTLYRKLY